jgi:hypothetical protein
MSQSNIIILIIKRRRKNSINDANDSTLSSSSQSTTTMTLFLLHPIKEYDNELMLQSSIEYVTNISQKFAYFINDLFDLFYYFNRTNDVNSK